MTARARLLAVVAAAGLTASLVPGVRAARLPSWAREIADTAPALPDGLPADHLSRVLLSETFVHVNPDGTLRVRQRTATQALGAGADEVGLGWFPFDEDMHIERSKAWHLAPSGKTRKSDSGDEIDLGLDDIFLSDHMTRFIHLDGIERGSLAFFEFEATERPVQLAWQVLFYEDAPTDVSRLSVELPEGWDVRSDWLRESGPQPTVVGNVRTWEVRDLRPAPDEPLGEWAGDRAPLLVVGFVPAEGTRIDVPLHADWQAAGAWYERIAEGRDEVTPEIAALSREMMDPVEGGLVPRVQTAGMYVRDRVRYVAKDVGAGGYRPRPAAQVLTQLYGDCKDKTTLLRAILAADGHDAYPVLVHATLRDTVSADVPSLGAFNHVILGVPVPEGDPLPESLRPATVQAEGLGRLVLVDATSEYTTPGTLPPELAGKTGLLVAGEATTLVELPAADPEDNRIDRFFQADLAADGAIEARLEIVRHGAPAADARRAWRHSSSDYGKTVERALLELWPGASVNGPEVLEETPDGAFHETVTVRLSPSSLAGSSALLEIFPTATDDLPRVSLSHRETAVVFDYPLTLHSESVVRGMSPTNATPRAEDASGDGWSMGASFERDGDELRGSWDLVLSRVRTDTSDLRELKRMWSAARRTSGAAVSRR